MLGPYSRMNNNDGALQCPGAGQCSAVVMTLNTSHLIDNPRPGRDPSSHPAGNTQRFHLWPPRTPRVYADCWDKVSTADNPNEQQNRSIHPAVPGNSTLQPGLPCHSAHHRAARSHAAADCHRFPQLNCGIEKLLDCRRKTSPSWK